jgi:membrane protein DedA with SNARE-associated domain
MPESQIEYSQDEKLTSAGRKKVEWTTKKIVMVILFTLIIIISIAVLVWTFIDKTFLFSLIRDYFILPIESAGEYVRLADKFIIVVDIWIERWGIWSIIVGRAVPLIMFDPVSYAAGLSNIKWKPYTLATFIGSIPRAIFFAYFGSSMIDPGVSDIATFIRNLSQKEFEQVARQFNLIFYIIFGVLVLMLVTASFLSNRVAKKRELEESDSVATDEDKSDQNKIVAKEEVEEVEQIDSDIKD